MTESDEIPDPVYVRSQWSTHDCVEVARLSDGRVSLRNSRDVDRVSLIFTADEWSAFLRGVRSGNFDQV